MSTTPKYVIITPVRDEAPHVGRTIESVISQSVRPHQWIIVDDGSTDGTAELLDRYASSLAWLEVVHKYNRGYRSAGGGVIDAFYAGYARLANDTWDFIVKLDADLSFAPNYFAECFEIFAADARLGIGGGTVYRQSPDGHPKIDSVGDPPFHVRGATKIYRRDCWQQIAPLEQAPGWDTIDEVKANLHGWTTRTFPGLPVLQHKPTGSADGAWRNWFKNGRANYLTGYHPLFMLAKCIRRLPKSPVGLGGAALFAGYFSGYLSRRPQMADQQAIRYLRQQQLRRLLLRPSIYR
jgi:glycosyltransferase involved in cell wall biosynthesis